MQTDHLRIFFGIFLTIWGLGAILNRHHLREVLKDALAHPAILLIFAVIPLVIGAFAVSTHNVWHSNREVGITLLGWLFLAFGTFKTLLTRQCARLMRGIEGTLLFLISGIVSTVFGIALLLADYF